MNEQQSNKKKFNWWWLLVVAAVVLVMVQLASPAVKIPEIYISEFRDQAKVVYADGNYQPVDPGNKQETIWGVYKEAQTYYILYTADYENNNPKRKKLTSVEQDAILADLSLIKSYASAMLYSDDDQVTEIIAAAGNIRYGAGPEPTSWVDWVVPIIYITLILGVIIMLWRGMSGRNGLSSMTQNRATVVFNGPTRFTDVAGIDEEKEQVAEIVDFLRNPKKFVDMGARIPKGVLLIGQPGTGKTLLAKAIAGEAGVPFFSLSGSDFSEMLVGVGPARMRDLFEQAKKHAPAIIFLDELDSIARMRGVGASGVAEENEQTLNQLLVQMDGFSKSEGVIVLAATNRPDVLDPAILRPGRFDRQIVVQMPDVIGREKILQVHAKNKPMGNVDLNRVAKITSGFTGADLENLLNESAIIAAKDNRTQISMNDILEGIDKVMMGPQKKSRIITHEDKKITAFHESGHAIVSRILLPEQTVQEVSIIPRGMAAGYTLTNDQDNERNHQSLTMLKNRLVMLLGGRCAEQMFIGDICTGASNDLKVATDLAEKMVTRWGMSEKLGPIYYGKEDEVALRITNHKQVSEALQATIDSEIKAFITNAMAQCKKLLSEHAAEVKVMTEVLLANETIYAEDIAMILQGKSADEVNKNITDRQNAAVKANNDERVKKVLDQLNPLLDRSMEIAQLHLAEQLVTEEHLQKLKANCELARAYAREKMQMPPIPTIDFESLDKYPSLLDASKAKDQTKVKEVKVSPKKAPKPQKAKTTDQPKPAEQPKNEQPKAETTPEKPDHE